MTRINGNVLIIAGAAVAAVLGFTLYQTGLIANWTNEKSRKGSEPASKYKTPIVIELPSGDFALELSDEAIASLELNPKEAKPATTETPLPPMVGSINYDNDRQFFIKPPFAEKLTEIMPPKKGSKNGSSSFEPSKPMLKFGDKVEQIGRAH